ncbi:MAG: aromatic amino acid transport family protein [Gammaproteobacteria bacterium]
MKTNRLLGSIFLIAGTSIGAGMLALPVATANYGVFPAICLFVLCWLCMLATGLLLLEVNLWLKPETNIVSMAQHTLGVGGKIVAWITYLLLFYAVMSAYVSGMGDLVSKSLAGWLHWHISTVNGALALAILVGAAVYTGAHIVDYTNRFFFIAKILTYLAVLALLTSHVNVMQLSFFSTDKMWLALPVAIVSFGYQNLVPSLRVYLNNDVKKIRRAILIGSTVPLIVYILWEIVIIGVLPLEGPHGLKAVLMGGQPATGLAQSLDFLLGKPWLSLLFKAFTFFAIATSFIGVSFSLFDFLIDSFQLKRNAKGKITSLVLTFLPPLLFAFFYPNGFVAALGYGGIFVAILFGILPVLMVWSGRYWKKIATGYRVDTHYFGLILLLLFSVVIIVAQLMG